MTTEELNAALDISRKIKRMQAQLSDLRASGGVGGAGLSAPVMGGVSISPGQIVIEIEGEIAELQQRLAIEQEIIRRALAKIPLSDVEQKVMGLRYVECWGWRDISQRLGYSEAWIYKIHEKTKIKSISEESAMKNCIA